MKKTYEKPALTRAGRLSQTVAIDLRITGFDHNGNGNGLENGS